MMNTSPKIIIMVDIETLGKTSANVIVTQMAVIAAPADDLSERVMFDSYYLPLQPQIEAGRKMDGDTICWWMDQDDAARQKFSNNLGGDSDSLIAFVRAYIRKIAQVIDAAGGNYEVWAKGPQFDISIMESLFAMCGETPPWEYNTVRDLRTLMAVAGIHTADVDSHDIVPHVALEDCRFQLRCYDAAIKVLGEPA